MSKNKIKKPLFYRIYFGTLIAFGIILIVALSATYIVLDSFEETRPKNYAQNIFETYFKTGDYAGLLEECSNDANPFENRKDVKKAMAEKYKKDDLEFISVYSSDPSVYNYQVTCDGELLGTFTIENDGIKNSLGFEGCKLTQADIAVKYGTVTVKALSDSKVYFNETLVDKSFISESDVKSPSCDFVPDGVKGITYDIYTVDGFLCQPEIKIVSDKGEHTIEYNEEESQFEAALIYDDKLEAEYAEYCLNAIKSYAKFMQRDGKRAEALKYIDRDSELYYNISSNLVQFVNYHNGSKFENESVSEFYSYDENTFSCRVIMDHILLRSETDKYIDHIDMTIYLRRVGDKFLIYKWSAI